MTKQKVISLHLTTGELDVLASIVQEIARHDRRQHALIWHLRRAYRNICKKTGRTPNTRLIFDNPLEGLLTPDELEKRCDTLADILAAAQIERDDFDDNEEYEYNDYGQPAEVEPEEEVLPDDDDDMAGGWIAC